jgi:hypothetical protein
MDCKETVIKYRLISKDEWEEKFNKESLYAIHPCDHFHPDICDCKGCCSCHWVKEKGQYHGTCLQRSVDSVYAVSSTNENSD